MTDPTAPPLSPTRASPSGSAPHPPWWRTARLGLFGRLPDTQGGRALVIAIAIATLLVLFRSAVFVLYEESHFDSDQALLGLMAKHISEGRAFPVFSYGEHYLLVIESWLAAPLFLLTGGASVAALKAPLVLMNVAIGVLLILLLAREGGLKPAVALVAALFFLLPAPGTTTLLLSAGGGNVEPFLWVLLLWMTRSRPLAFGVILAVGVLNRQFTAYGLMALLVLECLDGTMFTRAFVRAKLVAASAFAATWQIVMLLYEHSSVYGPKTTIDSFPRPGVIGAASRFCFDPSTLPASVIELGGGYLSMFFGGRPAPLVDLYINSTVIQGTPGLWWIVGPGLALALGRVIWSTVRQGARPWTGPARFGTYLFLVGLQAIVFYGVSRCGEVHVATMRYILLALFGATGIVACHLAIERSRPLRVLTLALPLVVAASALVPHLRLQLEYVTRTPVGTRRILADHLVENGIRTGVADFWDAYSVTFLSDERVILASSQPRIQEYEWLYVATLDRAVSISRTPCEDGTPVAGMYYVCPP